MTTDRILHSFIRIVSKTAITSTSYSPPLDQFLTLGQPKRQVVQFDCAAFGITLDHAPDLMRMLDDEALNNATGGSDVVWAPLYAWRAGGALKAEAAIIPMLHLMRRIDENDDDWVGEDVPRVLASYGLPALLPTADYLGNTANDDWARVAAAKTLGMIGQQHPELRDQCVHALRAQLVKHAEQSAGLNAFLISSLLDLKAVEAMPEIKTACDADHVDETVAGDYEDFEIELGLKQVRAHPPKPNELTRLGAKLRALPGDGVSGGEPFASPGAESLPRLPEKRKRIGRNEPCPCGSGKKYKKCCGKA